MTLSATPLSEAEVRGLAEDAVRRTSAARPGDAAAVVTALQGVYERWAKNRVTSEMGGGGGTGAFAEPGAVYLSYQSPGLDWDVKLEWGEGRWQVTAVHPDSGSSLDAEENRAALPLVEAFLAGLYFD
jgi:hypothetical protein